MKRTLCVVGAAALVLAVMSGAALAAQIQFYGQDTTTGPNWQGVYGAGQAVYWDFSSGRPDYTNSPTNTGGNPNPNYVQSFTYQNTMAGGGNSGPGGANSSTPNGYGGGLGTTGVNYNLVMNESMTFYFTALFYDSTYSADNGGLDPNSIALEVRLVDPSAAASTDESWHAISVAQLQAGTYEIWSVNATDGDTIQTQVDWANGAGVGAAGFFLDDVTPTTDPPVTPEPATSGLLGLGLASFLAWRKKRFGAAKEDRRASDFSRLDDI
jgi:hypothetical protein